jgi:hypothetical protein
MGHRESFFNKKYLEGIKVDREGYPIDPWGNRYIYDKKNHVVKVNKK